MADSAEESVGYVVGVLMLWHGGFGAMFPELSAVCECAVGGPAKTNLIFRILRRTGHIRGT
jgi:hypothetical protein